MTRYSYTDLGYGIVLYVQRDSELPLEELVFLQGDDASDVDREIAAINDADYPSGPFDTADDLLQVFLSQYDYTV